MTAKEIYELTQLKRGMELETMEKLNDELTEIRMGKYDVFYNGALREKFDNGKGVMMALEVHIEIAQNKLSKRITNKKWGK